VKTDFKGRSVIITEAKMMSDGPCEKTKLLKRTGELLNSIIEGLNEVDMETKQKIMKLCGETCASSDGDLEIAKRIAEETTDEREILARVNKEILWCGTWTRKGNTIQSVCVECGCPLVGNKVVKLTETFCYCSRGWIKKVFETVLKRPLDVQLKKSIGRGDKFCKFVIRT
jgi:predicted hydrocarbon binding protein